MVEIQSKQSIWQYLYQDIWSFVNFCQQCIEYSVEFQRFYEATYFVLLVYIYFDTFIFKNKEVEWIFTFKNWKSKVLFYTMEDLIATVDYIFYV